MSSGFFYSENESVIILALFQNKYTRTYTYNKIWKINYYINNFISKFTIIYIEHYSG